MRHDIIEQLRLTDPDKDIASFHRSNLHYVVRECGNDEQDDLLLKASQFYGDGNVIVYAPMIRCVTATVAFLEDNESRAVGYHGKMDAETRWRNFGGAGAVREGRARVSNCASDVERDSAHIAAAREGQLP